MLDAENQVFVDEFNIWKADNRSISNRLKLDLMMMGGCLDESEIGTDFHIFKIPLDKLSNFKTACGNSGKSTHFSEKVLNFLESKDIKFIIALVVLYDSYEICSAIINVNKEDANTFSELIDESGGSLRPDTCGCKGWTSFESE